MKQVITILFLLVTITTIVSADDDIVYTKPTYTKMCWLEPGGYDPKAWVTFQVVQEMPEWAYNLSIKWSQVQMNMKADGLLPGGYPQLCDYDIAPPYSCFFTWYLPRTSTEEISPGILRVTWQGANKIDEFYWEMGDSVEFIIQDARVRYHSGVYAPCHQAPCVVLFDEAGSFPFSIEPEQRIEIGDCIHMADMGASVYLPISKRN